MSDKKKFITVRSEGSHHFDSGSKRVIVDDETRVNYLFVKVGTGSGLTALVDADGNPLRSTIISKKENL